MKNKEEVKKRIEGLKSERDNKNKSHQLRNKYNGMIRELEWILDE